MSLESQARQRIAECQANIAHIDSQVKDLLRLRERDRETIAALRFVVSPIRQLPCELLAEIFQLVIQDKNYRDVPVKDVLTLTQVCPYWRQVAQTTPRLWLRQLPVWVKDGRKNRISLDATKVFLERSAPLPLHIQVAIDTDGSQADQKLLMPQLLDAAHRWRTLRMSLRHLPELVGLGLEAGALMELETIYLSGFSGVISKPTTFISAPRLRTVTLFDDAPFLPMPWPQLTHLDLTTWNTKPEICLDTIIQCTNLIRAKIHTQILLIPVSSTASSTLSRLEELDIYLEIGSSGDHFTPFLRRLNAPALKTLRLSLFDDESLCQWSGTAFRQFQLQSAQIQSLSLSCIGITSQELRDIFLHAAEIKDLEISCCFDCVDDDSLSALEYCPSDTYHLVPKLERLTLESVMGHFDEARLEAVIDSRWWTDQRLLSMPAPAVARFKSMTFLDHGGAKFTRRFIDKMERYRSEGLDVKQFFPDDDDDGDES
ncbi:hypothetical protein DFH06DRAFT_1186716 [Mycena polygramma]|nr:hypothetical protein DFH06DRAFT_1186716 [Mycena polygramma]